MKAITLWQPWASLILIGAKPYEFRSWKPPQSIIGQRIAIHAGARKPKIEEIRWLKIYLQRSCLHDEIAWPALDKWQSLPNLLPLSHILCTALLGKPRPGDAIGREWENRMNDSDREGTFNWGWPLTEIEPVVPPYPVRGHQGFWNWEN